MRCPAVSSMWPAWTRKCPACDQHEPTEIFLVCDFFASKTPKFSFFWVVTLESGQHKLVLTFIWELHFSLFFKNFSKSKWSRDLNGRFRQVLKNALNMRVSSMWPSMNQRGFFMHVTFFALQSPKFSFFWIVKLESVQHKLTFTIYSQIELFISFKNSPSPKPVTWWKWRFSKSR